MPLGKTLGLDTALQMYQYAQVRGAQKNKPLSSTVRFKSRIKLYLEALTPLYAVLPGGRVEPARVRSLRNELAAEFERRRVQTGLRVSLGVENTQ
jgi:hypothetical protein